MTSAAEMADRVSAAAISLDDQMKDAASIPADEPRALPEGDYAIVEIFGHSTIIGRVVDVERFGTKMLGIEPIFNGQLLPQILHGGASIYRFTRCSAEVAFAKGATQRWQLPGAVQSTLPAELLAPPRTRESERYDDDEDLPF